MSLGECAYFFMTRVSMERRFLSAYQWVQTPQIYLVTFLAYEFLWCTT